MLFDFIDYFFCFFLKSLANPSRALKHSLLRGERGCNLLTHQIYLFPLIQNTFVQIFLRSTEIRDNQK